MKIISHRGCLQGPDELIDNTPEAIDNAISKDFDVEVDLWRFDNTLFLGHDAPKHSINLKFLLARAALLWIHCKNIRALDYCLQFNLNCFYHQTDDCTLTSKGYIWTYPNEKLKLYQTSIQVLPEIIEMGPQLVPDIAGVCTDYPERYRDE